MAPESNSKDDKNHLGWAIAGGIAGAILLGAGIAGIVHYFKNKSSENSKNEDKEHGLENKRPLVVARQPAIQTPCIICQKETDRNDRTIFRCNHIAHLKCYYALRENGGTNCPVPSCRKSFVE